MKNILQLNTSKTKSKSMINKKLIIILLFISIAFISLSAVSAVELNDTSSDNSPIARVNEADDVISVNNADEKLSDANSNYQINDMKCEFKETGYFYGDAKLQLKLTNATSNKCIEGKAVNIFVDKILLKEYKTNSNGLINLNFNKMPGTYNVVAKLKDSGKTIGDITFTIAGIPSNFELDQTSAYYKDAKLVFKLVNLNNNKGIANAKIAVKFSNGKKITLTTNSKGVAGYNIPFKPGTYSVTAVTASKFLNKNEVTLNKFPIGKTYLTISSKSLTVKQNSKKTLNIKATNYFTKHAMKNVKLALKVYTGKKYKTVVVKTDKNGIAKYDASKLSIGAHKIIIMHGENYLNSDYKKVTVKVTR